MKKRILLLLGISFISIISFAQILNWQWAKGVGGTDWDGIFATTIDTQGNIYVVGIFNSPTITFGSTTLTNNGEEDIFIAKYNSNGNVLWAKSAGGIYEDRALSVIVDASGNIVVTGSFNSPTITFGTTTLTNNGNYNIFIAKYNNNGDVLWAKSAGSNDEDFVSSIVAVDATGNIIIAGSFSSPTITFGSTTLINNGGSDTFLTKYNTNGNVIWAKSAGGISTDFSKSMAVDATGNIIVSGSFKSPTITFGSTTLTSEGDWVSFLTKYNTSGDVLWAKSDSIYDGMNSISVSVDKLKNIYLINDVYCYYSAAIKFCVAKQDSALKTF